MTLTSNSKLSGLRDRCKAQNGYHYGNFDHLALEELPRSHAISVHIGTLGEIISHQVDCVFCSLVVSAISAA